MNAVPNHIALILDGNRRWARSKGLGVLNGHREGANKMEALLDRLNERGVKTVTLWVFSTENWKRDDIQVKGLMSLFEEFLDRYYPRAIRDKVRVIHLGRTDRIPKSLLQRLEKIQEDTKHFEDRVVNIALDYGGRDEVLRAIKRLSDAGVDPATLTEQNFNDYLDTNGQPYPEPDLIVRTGGDMRTSGLMIWQAAYAEYVFVSKFLPDMTPDDMDKIIDGFGDRERRFGGGK